MAATLSIEGVEEVAKRMGAVAQKQMPFATSKALNDTAKDVHVALGQEIKDVFDRPTPFTQRSPYYKKTSKRDLQVEMGIRNFAGKGIPATKFLMPHVVGGQRPAKRFEIALRRAGVMPAGHYAIPGEGARRDAYGNMSRGQITQILSYFRTFPEQGYRANMKDSGRKRLARDNKKRGVRGITYFVSRGTRCGDNLRPGVYARTQLAWGSAVKPVLIFVPWAMYEAGNFDYEYVVWHTVEQRFTGHLSRAFGYAMSTAR